MRKLILSFGACSVLFFASCQKQDSNLPEATNATEQIQTNPPLSTKMDVIIFNKKADESKVTTPSGTYDIIKCIESGHNCYVNSQGLVIIKRDDPVVKTVNSAIDHGTTAEFFNKDGWQKVFPMLVGTNFLKGLQSGSLKMIRMSNGKSEEKCVYVGVKNNISPERVSKTDIVFAIDLNF